jgi:hypothetical protein
MKKAIVLFCILLLVSKTFSQTIDSNKEMINTTLDSWHKAAANAEFDIYFSYMTSNGVFIGTDATENWQLDAFKTFSKPYFDKGKAWNFTSLQRNIYFDKSLKTAWFDELLDTQMKICRGSGVLIKEGKHWKIAHYVLSMTIPNDNTDVVVKIKEKIENDVLEKLKAK